MTEINTTDITCTRCGICCKAGTCPFGTENKTTGICKYLIKEKSGIYSCKIANKIKNEVGIGKGCILKRKKVYKLYLEHYN